MEALLLALALTEVTVIFLSLLTAKDFSAKQAKLHDAVLGVGGQPMLPAEGTAQRGGSRKTGCIPPTFTAWRQEVPHLLPYCFVPLLSRIPAALLTLIFALESVAMLAFPSVAETRQPEGQLPGAVKALPGV